MKNLIDHRISPEKLIKIRESIKKNQNKPKRNFLGLFSAILLAVFISSFAYFHFESNQAEAVQFGLGNNYEEILRLNEEFANNVPLSIDSISVANRQGDKRVVALLLFLQKYSSPMATPSVAQAFIDHADKNGFGDKWEILPAIAGIESAFGRLIPRTADKLSYNAWGWSGGSKYGRWSYFDSWEDAVAKVSAGLAKGYSRTGYDPMKMMASYCPPCARPENNAIWARTVKRFIAEMNEIYKSL
jgi:hypothetical protein